MTSAALLKLQRLLGMVRTAEESRLARAMAEIAACHARAARLRREAVEAGLGVASSGDRLAATDLVAGSRWVRRLAQRAGAEEARAVALGPEAAVIRECLVRAFGRESVAAAMLHKARGEERRLTARRAEDAIIARRITSSTESGKALDQSDSSDSGSDETSAGSPGIA